MEKGWNVIKWSGLILFLLAFIACFALIFSTAAHSEERAFALAGSLILGIILCLTLVIWCLVWLVVVRMVRKDSPLLRCILLLGSFVIALFLAYTSQLFFPIIR